MHPIRTFCVIPALPPVLERLRELAYNLRWTWSHETIALFRRLDRDLWETTRHNPVLLLGSIDQAQLDAAAADPGFLAQLERVYRDYQAYMSEPSTWFRRTHGPAASPLIAYFSAEFGLTECLSIFAGGLGLLAGDHLKSASDLGVPLVAVGLLYQQGYFRQRLNDAGWQQEVYEDNDFHNLPLTLERGQDDAPLLIDIPFPGTHAVTQVWRAQAGRISLYLLDTNLLQNPSEYRDITDQLYGGDLETRLKQEFILGIGGSRALDALGLTPAVYHMNEGHSAFLGLERIRTMMERHGLGFAAAREAASAGLIFTTHTPVAAGHDYFPPDLMDRYFGDYARSLGLSRQEFLALGRQNPADDTERFCMTGLALRLATHSNGVSRLHEEVSRAMWQHLWPGTPVEEIPIRHVTNGAHLQSWISHEMDELYDRYLGPRWREEPADQAVWAQVRRIPAEEWWRTHERRRERLVLFVRRWLRAQLERRGAAKSELETTEEALDPNALTIGFARRFATYKRATLLLRDPERLARLLDGQERPVQILFAGKAHPKDDAGKELIQQIVMLTRREPFRRRIVFLEDYGMTVARYLLQGVDVWLNMPRRPHEASGTSGMKALANGALNVSALDGWWDEAWNDYSAEGGSFGWAVGRGEAYASADEQDAVEAEALYDILERDVIPTFYHRGEHGLPQEWIARMKESVGTLCHRFNSHRMVREYVEGFYMPAVEFSKSLEADGLARAQTLAEWKARLYREWNQVGVEMLDGVPLTELAVGGAVPVRARVHLGALTPDDVQVEVYLGRLNASGNIIEADATPMRCVGPGGEEAYVYEAAAIPCHKSGLHGYTVRVRPRLSSRSEALLPGLITWARAA